MVAEGSSQYNIHDAKTNLSRIIERVEHGEEIVISRAGTPVAKLVPLAHRVRRTGRGSLRGALVLAPDWDSPQVNEAIADDFGIGTSLALPLPKVSLDRHHQDEGGSGGVRWLLDTHVVLWWLLDDPTLSAEIKEHIDEEPGVHVSTATIWEVAIKQAAGKLSGPASLPERIRENGFVPLPISFEHAITAARLPLIHRDPFDRLLIAQAQCEKLTFVTRDENCRRYEVAVLPALPADRQPSH